MRVEFAAYGDRNGAHALKATTFQAPVVEQTLQITDLAWGLPDHLGDLPMYRARAIGSHYVLAKTVRDKNASRPGMASTIVAFFPIEDVILEGSFSKLVELLPDPSDTSLQLVAKDVPVSVTPQTRVKNRSSGPLVKALLNSEDRPVVWAGMEEFIEVASELWSLMSPPLRQSFGFAFVCDPSVSNKEGYSVLYCPTESASKWTAKLITKGPMSDADDASTSELYFLDGSIRTRIDQFINELGIIVTKLPDLRRACSCFDTLQDLNAASNLEVTKLLRNIGILSPQSDLGRDVKSKIIGEICKRIRSGSLETIKLIRNIDFDDFNAADIISNACQDSIHDCLNNGSPDTLSIAELVVQAITHQDRDWARGVNSGFANYSQGRDEKTASRIWEILVEKPELAKEDTILIPNIHSFDHQMAVTSPDEMSEQLADELCNLAVRRRLPELHAIGLASHSTVKTSIETLCDHWENEELLSSLRCFRNKVAIDRILEVLDQFDVDELFQIAAECCLESPMSLPTHFNFNSIAWQKVISNVISLSPGNLGCLDQIDTKLEESLQALLEDNLDPIYQRSLSQTRFANIIELDNRSEIWEKLDSVALPGFLSATTAALIDCIHEGEIRPESIETKLIDAILHEDRRTQLLPIEGPRALNKVINAFDTLNQLDERNFEKWRQQFLAKNRPLSNVDALILGKFISDRHWKEIAAVLADDVNWYNRTDLRPAVSQFTDLLSWIKQWQFGGIEVRVTADEWWAEVESTLAGLYSNGPRSTGIWERANGDPADLVNGGTSANQWRECLRDLRNGYQSGELTIKSLLNTASGDYPNNTHLRMLKETRPR